MNINNNFCPTDSGCDKNYSGCDKNSNLAQYLNDIICSCVDMSIYLINGIRLDGKIAGFDKEAKCIWVLNQVNENKLQVIFLSAISTISHVKPNAFKNQGNPNNNNNNNQGNPNHNNNNRNHFG
jgi:RNA chaperone Hfq